MTYRDESNRISTVLRRERGTLEKDVRGVRVGRREYLKQGRTKVGLSSVLRIFLCSYF